MNKKEYDRVRNEKIRAGTWKPRKFDPNSGVKFCNGCKKELPLRSFGSRLYKGSRVIQPRCVECIRTEQPNYKRHHLTAESYESMLLTQGYLCANIRCSNKATHIDHDHSCCENKYSCGNCVVGILCNDCNFAAGILRDNAEAVLGLSEYLVVTRKRNSGINEYLCK